MAERKHPDNLVLCGRPDDRQPVDGGGQGLHQAPAQREMAITDDVRTALDHGDLFLEYLPTVRLADARYVGAEALVRWRRGDDVMAAGDFIPQIENTPLSGKITYWVIETVAAELGEWLDAHRDAHISINVPPEILGRGGIEYAAIRSGLRARAAQIVLEITERGVPDRLGLDALSLMAERGVRLALDDTMLNGANLALLACCSFNMIKLAGKVTAQLGPDKPAPDWLAGLQALLKSSPLQVVAEGVESEYQAKWLRAAGVQMAQGFLFSRPLQASGLKELYATNRLGGGTSPRGTT
jgi:EAL domain-containing protein (putative c-di-GMP-specific phosphodiesterase class I)